jgi:general secretion pathway protein F
LAQFSYIAIKPGKGRVSGIVQTLDRRSALQQLAERGFHPISLVSGDSNTDVSRAINKIIRRVRTRDLALFTRQLGALTKAGLPLVQALATLRQQCGHKGLVRIIESVEVSLSRDAMSLAEALSLHPRVFDPIYTGLVRSGETSGNLPEVLTDLANQLSKAARLKGQVFGAFIYPAFLAVAGTTAIFVLMTFVIPKFISLFDSFEQELPLPTRILIVVAAFLKYWWPLVLGATFAAAAMCWGILRRPAGRTRFDRMVLGLPVIGDVLMKVEVARITQTLSAMLKGGIQIVDALRVTESVTRNRAIRTTFKDICAKVTAGQPLALAFSQAGIYPIMLVNLLRTGEETGELPEMLQEVEAIYTEESTRSLEAAVKILEPVLIIVMGAIIACIVAAVMLPIFRSNALVH